MPAATASRSAKRCSQKRSSIASVQREIPEGRQRFQRKVQSPTTAHSPVFVFACPTVCFRIFEFAAEPTGRAIVGWRESRLSGRTSKETRSRLSLGSNCQIRAWSAFVLSLALGPPPERDSWPMWRRFRVAPEGPKRATLSRRIHEAQTPDGHSFGAELSFLSDLHRGARLIAVRMFRGSIDVACVYYTEVGFPMHLSEMESGST